MVLRYVNLVNKYYEIQPDTVTLHQQTDPGSGNAGVIFDTATGIITGGTVDADLPNAYIWGERYVSAGSWADSTGTALLQFPAWVDTVSAVTSPFPSGTLIVGALAVMNGTASPTFPTRVVQEATSPQNNTNGNDKAFAFHYYCDGTECGTRGGNNPTTLSIPYGTSGTNAVLVWAAYSNAEVAASSVVSNQSSPAAFTHNVPSVTAQGGHPVVYAVVGRTSSSVGMGAHASTVTGISERASNTTTSSTKNNMGGVIYTEESVAAGSTPNRTATTNVGSFTIGITWALKKVFS